MKQAFEIPKSNRQWLLREHPDAEIISEKHFEMVTTPIPEVKESEILVKNCYVSCDPAQKGWALNMPKAMQYVKFPKLGEPMKALTLAQVVQSKNSKFKSGDLVIGFFNWQEYALVNPEKEVDLTPIKVPPTVDPIFMLSIAISGFAAYFGLMKIGKPKKGENILVSAAAGAVGSIVCQLGKILGCRVIGIVGGPDKTKWIMREFNLDGVIDYKNDDVNQKIAEFFPEGIDIYFDNVGGEILNAALGHLAHEARVVACGQISIYNQMRSYQEESGEIQLPPGPSNLIAVIPTHSKIEGFTIGDFRKDYTKALADLNQYLKEGKLKNEIDLQTGFENIPDSLTRIFLGKNKGKQLVKIADPPLPIHINALEKLITKLIFKLMTYRSIN